MSNSVPYVCEKRKIVVFWSQKSACTAIQEWFGRSLCNIHTRQQIRKVALGLGIEKQLQSYRGYTVYVFVRDPFERVVSGYMNKFVCKSGGGRLRTLDRLEPMSLNFLKRSGFDCRGYRGISFNQYLDRIEHMMRNRIPIDPHFGKAINTTLLQKLATQTDVYVVNVKHLSRAINTINQKHGVPPYSASVLNKTPQNPVSPDVNLVDVSSSDIDLSNLCYKNFEASRDRVESIFASDVLVFQKITDDINKL